MKKFIFLLALVAFSHSFVFSQGCLPEGITFTTQEEIDNFQTNYPGCTEIEGDVIVQGLNINNLNGLLALQKIDGSLWIKINSSLTNLSGLDGITYIGESLGIISNDNLLSLNGLESLTFIGHTLGIGSNNLLTDVSSLNSLSSIGENIFIYSNSSLMTLMNLNAVHSIDGDLVFDSNNALTTLSGLESMTSIGGQLIIETNHVLTDITALENINSNSITNLFIYENYSLSACDVQSICNYLASPNGTIIIHDNAPNCISPEEIQEHCLTSVKENITNDEITLFPNPASDFITVVAPQDQEIEEIIFYNQLGQAVLSVREATNTISISELSPGIYFAAVRTADRKLMTKVFIE